jgi:prolipoprotein diacylglyceryltransferase
MGLELSYVSVSLVIAWAVWSFLFWRNLRNWGTSEDRIFDLTFYATVSAVVAARAGYVVANWGEFADSPLRMFAIWVAPGMSFLSALIGAIATLVYLSRSYRVRLGLVLDAIATSLPAAVIIGKVGSFLSGVEIGRIASLPWAVAYRGESGMRHPVQVYEIIVLAFLMVVMIALQRRANAKKWAYGLLGVLFFLLFAIAGFVLELAKESSVYWGVTANQWILIGFFAESAGALYIRGGGREKTRLVLRHIYAAISKRSLRRVTSSP